MRRRRIGTLGLLVGLLAIVGAPRAGDTAATPLGGRLQELREAIVAEPDSPEKLFSDAFVAQVPPAQIAAILKQYHGQGGAVTRVTQTSSRGELYGEYRFFTEKGMSFPVKLGVEPAPPHKIHTLWFGLMQQAAKSEDQVLGKLAGLDGEVSLSLCRLGGEELEPLLSLEPDARLAIGSTFKLFVLGALVDEVRGGELSWADVVRLRDDWRSAPSGVLQDWPDGSPLTLHSLASQMISVSDNTATDHLLFFLGRQRVESMLEAMGHGRPALNVPFLSTRELFRIKEIGHADQRVPAYVARDAKGRRAYLRDVVAPLGLDDFVGIDTSSPTAIDRVEWFASTADLCRAMDWLRVQTSGGADNPAAAARDILAINRGLSFSDEAWRYVGYKGGSEPGVLNLTWLLEHRDGRWLALSATWNNREQALDEKRFFSLLESLIGLLEEPEAPEREARESDS